MHGGIVGHLDCRNLDGALHNQPACRWAGGGTHTSQPHKKHLPNGWVPNPTLCNQCAATHHDHSPVKQLMAGTQTPRCATTHHDHAPVTFHKAGADPPPPPLAPAAYTYLPHTRTCHIHAPATYTYLPHTRTCHIHVPATLDILVEGEAGRLWLGLGLGLGPTPGGAPAAEVDAGTPMGGGMEGAGPEVRTHTTSVHHAPHECQSVRARLPPQCFSLYIAHARSNHVRSHTSPLAATRDPCTWVKHITICSPL